MATEWLVEARGDGTCLVRMVMSGFGTEAGWDDELEGVATGMRAALAALAAYRAHFRGRRAAWIRVSGAAPGAPAAAWAEPTGALGLAGAGAGRRFAAGPGAPDLAGEVLRAGDDAQGRSLLLRRRLDQEAAVPLGDITFPAHAVFNLGISGDTAAGLVERLERELAPRQLGDQTIVVIAVGVNETGYDPSTGRPTHDPRRFAATLAELVAAARRHTDRVLLVGLLPCDEARMQPPPWSEDGGEHYANDRIAEFNQAVRRVAADTGTDLASPPDGLAELPGVHDLQVDGTRVRRWL